MYPILAVSETQQFCSRGKIYWNKMRLHF